MEAQTTNGITISVETQYIPEHSNPDRAKFIFVYYITIGNGSPDTVQLLSRHWIITNALGIVREVKGDGVVGVQPVITQGNTHAYSSFCDLDTEIGKMRGSYLMKRVSDGALFEVTIPEFRMVAPYKQN